MRTITAIFTLAITSFLAGLLASSDANADAPVLSRAVACCDSAANPSSCWVPEDAHDLSACDPDAEVSWCELTDGEPTACAELELSCCSLDHEVLWQGECSIEGCAPFEAGQVCVGPLIATPL